MPCKRPTLWPSHQQVGERERQLGEVLARQLASAQKAIETLMARVAAMTDARTEAEKALQAAKLGPPVKGRRSTKTGSVPLSIPKDRLG
jgi:hypothetical protein